MSQLGVAKIAFESNLAILQNVEKIYAEQSAQYDKTIEDLTKEKEDLTTKNQNLQAKYEESESQVKWFKEQLFGKKSEVRKPISTSSQPYLGESFVPKEDESKEEESKEEESKEEEEKTKVVIVKRKRRKKKMPNQVSVKGLQFDDTVEVEDVKIENPAISGLSKEEYEVIGIKESYMLAQKPSSYKVLKFTQEVIKLKGEISSNSKPVSVLEGSYADVSFLANLAIDKFQFHLPLYRQHQRLTASGIKLSRATLTNYVHRTADLLEPIYNSVISSISQGNVVWMDETPIKVGKSKNKMKQGYCWALSGQDDEVGFYYDASRGHEVIEKIMPGFKGTLQSDGHSAYKTYAKKLEEVELAYCWSHTRRKFIKAETQEPELAEKALEYIRQLYKVEKEIKSSDPPKVQSLRGSKSKLIVDKFFNFLQESFAVKSLLPSNVFTKAVNYALNHEQGLRVFLSNPEVSLDTNHLEREIRPIAIGRKNWMFCDTEAGAKVAAIFFTLIACCKLVKIHPYQYLVDVLQRVYIHPAKNVDDLIPRNWIKKIKPEDRLGSIIDS